MAGDIHRMGGLGKTNVVTRGGGDDDQVGVLSTLYMFVCQLCCIGFGNCNQMII